MKFKLTIKLGNDAMSEPGDVALALEKVAERLWNGSRFEGGLTLDSNGNTVGSWEVWD